MKLYEVPRRTWIKCNAINEGKPFYFWNVDGMYSRCSVDTDSEEYFHIAAWADVEVVNVERNDADCFKYRI